MQAADPELLVSVFLDNGAASGVTFELEICVAIISGRLNWWDGGVPHTSFTCVG
jgi:hypothetical protein